MHCTEISSVQCNAVQCNLDQCSAMQYGVIQFRAIQFWQIKYCALQYSAIPFSVKQRVAIATGPICRSSNTLERLLDGCSIVMCFNKWSNLCSYKFVDKWNTISLGQKYNIEPKAYHCQKTDNLHQITVHCNSFWLRLVSIYRTVLVLWELVRGKYI